MKTAFKEAFAQKGMFKKVADKIELQEKVEQEAVIELKKMQDEERQRQREKEKIRNRYVEEFDNKVNIIMYGTKDKPKDGKNLMYHILCSYLPFAKAHRLVEMGNKQTNCCICKNKVISGMKAATIAKDTIFEHIRIDLDYINDDELRLQKRKELIQKTFSGRVLAVTSEDTNTVMCDNCHNTFVDWIQIKLMNEDRFVMSVLQKLRKQTFGF